MYRLSKIFTFEASHRLPNHDGKCARMHGHSWVGRIICEGDALQLKGPQAGMLVDYGKMKEALDPVVENYLDHYHLNETTGLKNPTSEELARWIYNLVKPKLQSLKAVEVCETCTTSCYYEP